MKLDFSGKNIVVTGASRGIGESIAKAFTKLGGEVYGTATTKEKVSELNDASTGIKYLCLDLSIEDSINEFLESIGSLSGVDVCVNNAGINKINPVYETELKDWNDIINVNLTGAFRLVRDIGNIMKNQGHGKIVNITSIFGSITKEKRAAYTASKAGLIGLTKTASVDLAPFNVLVNSVAPGFIETDLTKEVLGEKGIEELTNLVPMNRLGQPDEVANMVLFLASEYNTFLTGQNIIIDGGFVNI